MSHLICTAMMALIPCAHAAPVDSLTDRLERELRPFIQQRSAAGDFSGVVLVARNGAPIFTAAYGIADRARSVEVTPATRFNLGSMNKTWTAAAIAQLVDQHRIDPDSFVGKYLPDLPNEAIRTQVRVRHLLSHSSGLGTYFKNGFLANDTYVESMKDYLPFFINDSLSFVPGTRTQYSNAGFALLGMIIERVTGRSYYDYMNEAVLRRAGMTNASFVDLRPHPAGVSVGYTRPGPNNPNGENWGPIEKHSGPAGGAFATAADIVAFSRAWLGGKLASLPTVATFTSEQVDLGPMKYGFGFGVGAMNGQRFIGHNGGAPGVNTEYIAFPDLGIDVVVLTNLDDPAAAVVKDRAARIVAGMPVPMLAISPAAGLNPGEAPGTRRMGRPAELRGDDPRAAPARAVVQQVLSGDRAAAESYLRLHAAAKYATDSIKRDLDAIMTKATATEFTFGAVREGMRGGEVIVEVTVAGQTVGYAVSVDAASPNAISGVRLLVMMVR
jgi:CubicO group peptidase (beta-lactamase class C family)